ncbi:MAG TPA: hypothetical protein VJV75_09165 [Candidatus Polarisedimenticolia bacterium]|nr:hypothetical protein [Candidatus Polarisedimenticolia bacterium]
MRRYKPLLVGTVLGLLYGAFARWLAGTGNPWFEPVTLGFIFLVPLAMGYLSVLVLDRPRWWQTTFLPWGTWLLAVGLAFLVGWEGAICVVMAAPAGLILSSIGGWLVILVRRFSRKIAPAVLALPFVLIPLESRWEPAPQIRVVESRLDVAASRETVWAQIREVPPIGVEEQGTTLFNRIGFPRPVEARLFGEGVGAVRHATFERGVLFIERVTLWQEGARLAFTIHADSVNIPPSTLDEHVTIGGRYFDVLDGEYRLEDLPSGGTRVHLTSHHRLSTTMTLYAGLWTDAVMQSIQSRILEVIRDRSERATRADRSAS